MLIESILHALVIRIHGHPFITNSINYITSGIAGHLALCIGDQPWPKFKTQLKMQMQIQRICWTIALSLITLAASAQTEKVISFTLNNVPAQGVQVQVNGQNYVSDVNGQIKINASLEGQKAIIDFDSESYRAKLISGSPIALEKIKDEKEETSGAAPSSFSDWSGASVMYNFFDDSDINDLIGTANIKLSPFELGEQDLFKMNIVGTLSDIQDEVQEEMEKNIAELAQSNQGFQLGIQTWLGKEFEIGEKPASVAWLPVNPSFKFNSFSDTAANGESRTIGLPQGRLSTAVEFSGLSIKEGKQMYFMVEEFVNLFEATQYNEIFGEKKDLIFGTNFLLIIPIAGPLGFKITTTVMPDVRPIWSAGVIIGADN